MWVECDSRSNMPGKRRLLSFPRLQGSPHRALRMAPWLLHGQLLPLPAMGGVPWLERPACPHRDGTLTWAG